MKNVILISTLISLMFSCAKKEKLDSEYPQKWELIKMSGQIPNSEKTGTDMEWQENYLINSNGTFKKSRVQNGVLVEASGKYSYENIDNVKYLIFLHDNKNAIIGNCTGDLKETLELKSKSQMFSSWFACDGPGLEYSRTK